MNEDSVFDIIKECTKIFNEVKKKQNEDLNSCLDNCLNNLNSLKENIKNKNEERIEETLLVITISFLEGSKKLIHLKYSKYFLNILILLKRFIEYNLFSIKRSNGIIDLLKEFSNYSKLKDDCQNKILEILQTLLFSPFFEMKYDVLSNIYILILKSFNNINQSKNNKDFKNPIRLIFTTITEKVFSSNNYEIITPIIIFIFSWYNLSFKTKEEIENETTYDSDDYFNSIGNKFKFDNESEYKSREEIISILNKNKYNVYIRCLSLELLSQALIKINNKNEEVEKNEQELEEDNTVDIENLNKFIKGKILKVVISSINNIKNSNAIHNEDELSYLHYLKLCRFMKILLINYNIRYDIILTFTNMINDNDNKVVWKKYLSFEFLSSLITKYDLLTKIYESDEKYLTSIFNSLTNFANYIDALKDDKENKKSENLISNFLRKKELDNNRIYLEGDEIMVFKEQNKRFYKYLLDESLNNIIYSLMKEGKNVDKKICNIICDTLKKIINKLILNEIEKNTDIQNETECDLKIYFNHMMNIISLLGSLDMHEKGDGILKQLCKLAINFPEINDENNMFIALSLMKLLKSTDTLSKDAISMVLITLEVFNRRYNHKKIDEYDNSDLEVIFMQTNNNKKDPNIEDDEIIIDDKNEKEENEDDERGNENIEKESKKEKENINKIEKEKLDENEDERAKYRKKLIKELCNGIDSIFTGIYNLEGKSLKHIIEALSKCINLSIKFKLEKDKKNDSKNKFIKELSSSFIAKEEKIFYYKIIFYFTKILNITLINIDNIYILFDPVISIINELIDNKLLVDVSLEILCFLITEILKKHEKIELNVKKKINEENKIWIEEKWQKILFGRFLTVLSQPDLNKLIKKKIFICLKKIIQKSATYLDSFGWDSIIQSYSILSNYDIENSFLSVQRLLNDYNSNLSIINISPIMKLLQLFVLNKTNQKISLSSLDLFWNCANIIDEFKQEKRKIKEKEKSIYDNLLKEKELNVYCDELFNKLLSQINKINEDTSIEIQKNGIKIFTNIFASKMNNMNHEICLKIINDIFFNIFSTNAENYKSDNKRNDLEMIFQTSLISVVIILRTYFTEKEEKEEEEKKIYEDYLNKVIEIVPYGSPTLNTNIIKSLQEVKIKSEENVPLIITKMDLYLKLIIAINNYIKSPNCPISQVNRATVYILFNTLLSSFRIIFITSNHLEIYTDENLNGVFVIINTILESANDLEPDLLRLKPRKIIEIENDIFSFLEKILVKNNSIFNYLIEKMEIDIKNPHSEAICQRSLKCFQNIITKKDDKNIYGIKKEDNETIKKFIEKIKDIINLRNKSEIIEVLIKTNPAEHNLQESIIFKKYLIYFINSFEEICENYLEYKESINNEEINEEKSEIINNIYDIIDSVLDLFESIFKESNIDFKSINSAYIPIVNDIYQQMKLETINFIVNKLIFYILIILGDEEEKIFKKLEKKIIKIIKLSNEISDNNINNISYKSINQINELIKICQYKSNDEIIQNIDNNKKVNLDKYINFRIKMAKICSSLLIQKLIEILKNFRDYEDKLNDVPLNQDRVKEMVELLNNIKDLELFPNINQLEIEEEIEIKKQKITIFDLLAKTKKIHLFYLQPILNDFIYTREKIIKNIVKEIFEEVTKIMEIPNINDFNE